MFKRYPSPSWRTGTGTQCWSSGGALSNASADHVTR